MVRRKVQGCVFAQLSLRRRARTYAVTLSSVRTVNASDSIGGEVLKRRVTMRCGLHGMAGSERRGRWRLEAWCRAALVLFRRQREHMAYRGLVRHTVDAARSCVSGLRLRAVSARFLAERRSAACGRAAAVGLCMLVRVGALVLPSFRESDRSACVRLSLVGAANAH